ncbi:MAG: hypothetical protein RLY93_18280 [Sumerlaeia bacterium]
MPSCRPHKPPPRDVAADFEAYSSETWVDTDGLVVRPQSYDPVLYMDDVRLSNAVTVEHNVIGPGSIAHILRNRVIQPAVAALPAVTDSWFHYDQVGSVMTVTNPSGAFSREVYKDAFGNVMDNWATGLWANANGQSGWGHNTKSPRCEPQD